MGNVTEQKQVHGTVKWFNSRKGFGFIAGDDGKDYFVHYTGVKKGRKIEYTALDTDAEVTFTLKEGDRGPVAEDVELV